MLANLKRNGVVMRLASLRSCREKICFRLTLSLAVFLGLIATTFATAQDIKLNLTYVCNGERIYVESCNIRDLSDTSTCMVAHPDRPQHNGFMAYTTETRGTLKKLFPICKQPIAQEIAAEDAFKKKQQEIYDANVRKANPQAVGVNQQPAAISNSQPRYLPPPPKNADERAMRRCVSSGRLPATCTGNSLLGAFGQMLSSVLPGANKEPPPGPIMAGVFQGAGNWRLDFIDGGVLVNCSFLSPNQENYTIDFKTSRAVLTIHTTPKPLVLTFKPDGSIVGPGPVTINGVVASGYTNDAPSSATQKDQFGNLYDSAGNRVSGSANTGHTNFAPRRATCPALNLSSKGAGVGMQTMQTDLLKTAFGGDKGPPTPSGIRMHGIFAAPTGFSVQFFPESVILGCGPDAARAYSYTVLADGTKSQIKIDAPDHPLTLAFLPDGSLDPGTGPYQVHGRITTGQNDDGDFTFAPMEETCNLAVLAPSQQIPSVGGVASSIMATAGRAPAASPSGGGGLSTPDAPLGNATLEIVPGLPVQPGTPNPFAGRPYVLLRHSYATALANGGIAVPPGTSAYKYAGTACSNRTPDCQKIHDAIKIDAASAVRADASGRGDFPGVAPGTYYLMISTVYDKQSLIWGQAVQLRAGANSVTLDQRNATPNN